ncbi:unnamed protein product [Gongylonema pulchrum]|uniref:Helicase ATP-binding domain-containing protein n=1 Tax=Gongylonema pulchrum TaxID=637853 RepID=A0A183DNW8_9BILA|nr:unnamed protein product [Gongylonema pulchrum]
MGETSGVASLFRASAGGRKRRSGEGGSGDSERTTTPRYGRGRKRNVAVEPLPSNYTELLICGYLVKLPPDIQPYTTQRTMIAKILLSLKNILNALIESPTGSAESDDLDSAHSPATFSHEPLATLEEEFDNDFSVVGSPFVANKSKASALLDDSKGSKKDASEEGHTCLPRVTIYYGTRTHKQIGQVVKEFSRLPYGRQGQIRHTILASREHMCINPAARASADINAKCKELIARDGVGCSYKHSMRAKYERPSAIRRLISQTVGEANHIWDVEDLVEALRCSTPPLCPYFSSARVLIDDADIVFCPFTYLIDPIIRASAGLSLKNTIVILDEAHNVEDICREAVSFSFSERELVGAAAEFCQKAAILDKELAKVTAKSVAEEGLHAETESTRTGRYQECLEEIKGHFKTVINFMNKILDWFVSVSTNTLQMDAMKNDRSAYTYTWEKLFMTFSSSELDKFDKTSKGTPYSGLLWKIDLKKLFVCVDKPFVSYSRANVLETTASSMSNNEVLDMSCYDNGKEVWLDSRSRLKGYREVKCGYRAYISAFKGCRSVILASGTLSPMATFRTELGTDFHQEMIGNQIIPKEQIFAAVVPALVLKEPRRSSAMNTVMVQYEDAVSRPVKFGAYCTGALMLAVFRGKVSEGIDFADDRARCVITVDFIWRPVVYNAGISSPQSSTGKILSGDQWYTMQAYRALNQALGRCLRHRSDWGSILMLDERLQQTRENPNATKISKWIREQLRPLASYEHFISELTNFVAKMEEKVLQQPTAAAVASDDTQPAAVACSDDGCAF